VKLRVSLPLLIPPLERKMPGLGQSAKIEPQFIKESFGLRRLP